MPGDGVGRARKQVRISSGDITIALDPEALALCFNIEPERIAEELPPIEAPSRTRKRGVETRIILSGIARPIDEVLLGNIAKAHVWNALLREDKTCAEISAANGTPKRRIQQMLDLAFLAPDIVREIIEGRHPVGFTSDWCLRHDLPTDWQAQRELIATLRPFPKGNASRKSRGETLGGF